MRAKPLLAAAAAAAMSIAVAGPATAAEGGSMTVTFKDDISTFDPAIGYDWQNWSMIKSLFDGLMDYKPGTTELMPDLAESYEVSDDGLTYTFRLRGVPDHDRSRCQILAGTGGEPGDAKPWARFLRCHQGFRRDGLR